MYRNCRLHSLPFFSLSAVFSQYLTPLRAMSALKQGRYLVMLAMTFVFLYSIGQCIHKFTIKQIGEIHGTKRAAEMFYPSIVIVPMYDHRYAYSRTTGTMNLTKYYENRERIADKILMLQQSYESENG